MSKVRGDIVQMVSFLASESARENAALYEEVRGRLGNIPPTVAFVVIAIANAGTERADGRIVSARSATLRQHELAEVVMALAERMKSDPEGDCDCDACKARRASAS